MSLTQNALVLLSVSFKHCLKWALSSRWWNVVSRKISFFWAQRITHSYFPCGRRHNQLKEAAVVQAMPKRRLQWKRKLLCRLLVGWTIVPPRLHFIWTIEPLWQPSASHLYSLADRHRNRRKPPWLTKCSHRARKPQFLKNHHAIWACIKHHNVSRRRAP